MQESRGQGADEARTSTLISPHSQYEQRPYYIGLFGVHIAMLEKAVQHEHLSNFEGYKQRRLFTLLT